MTKIEASLLPLTNKTVSVRKENLVESAGVEKYARGNCGMWQNERRISKGKLLDMAKAVEP